MSDRSGLDVNVPDESGVSEGPRENAKEACEPLVWTVKLYDREPAKRYAVFFFALAAGAAGLLFFQSAVFALIGFVAILASTAEFWLPLRYRLDERGASVRCGLSVTAIDWPDVKRVVLAKEGWKLSPLGNEGRLSPFRGVYLRFGEEPEAVRAYVSHHVDQNARFVEHGADAGGGGDPPSQGSGPNQETGDDDPGDPRSGGP